MHGIRDEVLADGGPFMGACSVSGVRRGILRQWRDPGCYWWYANHVID